MTIEWTDDAVDEALNEFAEARESMSDTEAMRAALTAAVKYQQLFYHPDGIAIAKDIARVEALEDAEKAVSHSMCDPSHDEELFMAHRDYFAKRIRALNDT